MTAKEKDWEKLGYKVEPIPVDKVDMGQFQARTKKVEEGLEDLAENIRKLGLLNPVTVYQKPDGRFDLIAGQRRFLAVTDRLKWKTIPARILPYEPSDSEAKAISLSENIIREDLAESDVKNSIMLLYTRCGASGTAISETLGIPYWVVLSVLKYEDLPKKLKQAVDKQEIDVDLATRATNLAIQPDGKVDEEFAVEVAQNMKTMLPEQQKALVKNVKENPDTPLEDNVEEAKKAQKTKQIRISLLMHEYDALDKYANAEKIESVHEAAWRALTNKLKEMGYLEGA
jgi:ParB family chromosome partitioning protein